ncbi:MAG: FtsX-like permease family protein [bacterium]|nr:FtsX-like permease family protein [bacterium]
MKITKAEFEEFLVRLQDALYIAFVSMYSNKMRTILTVLGIIIGVGTVVGLISLVAGLNDYVLGAFSVAGSDTFWVMRFNPINPDYEAMVQARSRPDIVIEDAFAIRDSCPSVEFAAPRLVATGDVKYRDKKADNIYIVGTSEEFQTIQGIDIAEGRILLNSDVTHNRLVCALGSETKDALFGDSPAVGKKVKVKGRTFVVSGVAEPMGSFMGQSRDNMVIIPATTFQNYFYNKSVKRANIIMVKPLSAEHQERAIDEVTALMRNRHGLKANEEDDFDVLPQSAFTDAYKSLTGVIFVVIIAIGGISLLVGGVGIMNIMLVSVSERTREIGLRKSLGAKQADILLQFLIESVVMSVVGGALGVVVGILIGQLVTALTPLPASINTFSVILGVTFATAVGAFFGIYPARKASRLNPIEALRQN